MTEQVLGPYRLTVARATGRDGDRFDAWDTRVNRALDLVSLPRLSRRASDGALLYRGFFEEAEQQALLRHPNLRAAVEHSARDSMDAWYVMERTAGASLQQLLDTVKRLPWLQGVCIMHELAVALAFAHGRGVVHAHIRPSQVLLQRRGRVILSGFDFGLKTFIRTNVAAFEGLNDVMEDEVYVAPETLRLSDPGPRSDLFSLGVLSFEMFTGRVPFDNADAIRHYARSRRSVTPDPWDDASHLPEALRDLLMELIAPTIDGRPLSVAEVQLRLGEMLAAEGITDIHGSLRSSFSRQSAVFPRDEEDGEATAIIPAMGERTPTSRRGPVRRSTVPGLGQNDDDPRASQRRDTVRERGSKTTAKGVAPAPEPKRSGGSFEPSAPTADGLIPKPDPRRSTDRYASSGDPPPRKPVRRSIALQILADEGYLAKPEKRSSNITRGLVAIALIAISALAIFYIVVLQNPANTRVVSSDIADRGDNPLGTPPDGPFEGEAVDPGAGSSFRRATARPPSSLSLATSAKLDKVNYQLKRGDYAAAERIAAAGLRDSPASVGLLMGRARALFKLDRVDEALGAFKRADEVAGRGVVEGQLTGARMLEDAGQLSEALATYVDLSKNRDDTRLLAGAGRVFAKLKRFDLAREALRRAVLKGDADSATYTLLADLELAIGKRADAQRYYALAVENDPNNEPAARALAKLGETAEPGTTPSETATPSFDAADYERAGDAAYKRKSYRDAAKLFAQALAKADKPDPRLYKNLALALQASGQRSAAIRAWTALAKARPTDEDAHFQLGRLLLAEGRGTQASQAFRLAVGVNPRAWEPRFELGRLALADKRYSDAADRFREVLTLRPNDAAATQNLGKALLEAGEPGRAALAFKRLADLQPSEPAPLLTAASLFRMAGKTAEARAALAAACRRGATEACAQP